MKLLYCPTCGAELFKKNATTYECTNGHPYWNNPRTAVAVVLIQDGAVLVSKRGIEPRKGTYDFPGGFLDYNEPLFTAAAREMEEECGLLVSEFEIIASYTSEYIENISVCDLVVRAKSWQGEPAANDDSAALEWQPVDFLDTAAFTAPYTGLSDILRSIIAQKSKL